MTSATSYCPEKDVHAYVDLPIAGGGFIKLFVDARSSFAAFRGFRHPVDNKGQDFEACRTFLAVPESNLRSQFLEIQGYGHSILISYFAPSLTEECGSLPSIPQENWYCKYCENMILKEQYAEHNTNAIDAGRVAGINALQQITQRCIRIVETTEADAGGCAVCGGDDFIASEFNDRTVIICDQCEKDYHVGCLREQKMDDLKELPKDKWFCCTSCRSIHSALQDLVIDSEQMLPEALLNLVKKKHENKSSEVNPVVDIRWRLLSGKLASEDTDVWFSGAETIFHVFPLAVSFFSSALK
ncbi:unnamed protein product [Fraxinus pennsylvanica]|uniref:PHD-type domain-containing protein n=1 Tax=Fraxinus pennsylvanica TaxID=56036 RepID=A0AAD2EAG2_9LAMI|nr:unnamed protein product [Fraxinus pennsylvanica]